VETENCSACATVNCKCVDQHGVICSVKGSSIIILSCNYDL
jgi:hypothetical protein